MIFQDVAPGMEWRPEPAARYNAVNKLLSTLPDAPASVDLDGRMRENTLLVRNIGNAVIPAFHPAAIHEADAAASDVNSPLFEASQPDGETVLWGVVTEEIAPGGCGIAIMAGPAMIRAFGTPDGTDNPRVGINSAGQFEFSSDGAFPTAGRLPGEADGSCLAVIVLAPRPEPVNSPDAAQLCAITGGTAQTGYTVNIFGNGYGSAATGTGKVYVTELAYNMTLPAGTRIIGHPSATVITGETA